MPIDRSKIVWDDKPQIDASKIVWDDAPSAPTLKDKALASVYARMAAGVADPIMGVNALKDKLIGGAGQFVTSAGGLYPNAVSDWFGRASNAGQRLSDSETAAINQAREKMGADPNSTDWARVTGNVLSPANLAALPARGAGLAAKLASGAAVGAAQPVDTRDGQSYVDEKLLNTGLGAGTAGLFHGLGKGAEAAIDLLPTSRMEQQFLRAAQETGEPNTLARVLAEQAGSGVPGVRLSAAQVTQDPGITALEKGSRLYRGPAWTQFDTAQNAGMYNAMHDVVGSATDDAVDAARGVRDAATRGYREDALERADALHGPVRTSEPVLETLDRLLSGRSGSTPGAERIGQYVRKNIGRGDEPAAATYEVRKTLADALNRRAGTPLSELESSVKSSDVMSRALVASIDDALNRASGGEWQHYLDAFRGASKDVNSIEALSNIREALEEKVRGGLTDLAGKPKLTRAFINQVIEKNAANKYGPVISPTVQARLDKIRDVAQQIEAPQANYRAAVTGGGGSDTQGNRMLVSHLASHVGLGPAARTVGALAHALGSLGEERGATMLAETMQRPEMSAAALRRAILREAERKTAQPSKLTPAAIAALLSTK